ncbi:MAG: DNA polymerase III subunit gamma/tau [Vampirovibrionales bacterium]|jgi:DNA polymerase-3 subunit gamma/tau|nr:DNA polymerase III subunit gamma/tau [Vampirovibrionales bacterium]
MHASLLQESHLPLYRKYRPQSLPELVGQKAVAQTLSNAIALNRISHAYLFTGPRGTGKTSSARILAKSLNCVEGPTANPCQVCDSCVNITAGNDLDVIEFDAASNGGVEDARHLIESCQFAPLAGRYKIYIIDEIHMLSSQAFNALLKTLEEPPDKVIFIFATTEAHKVLPTIVSRCQQFMFNRIPTADIHQHLIEICQKEGLTIESNALLHLARKARGGLRDALSNLDQASVLARGKQDAFSLAELIEFLGEVPEEQMLALAEGLIEHDAQAVLKYIGEFNHKGIEARQVIKPLMMSLRHLLIATAVGADALTADDLDTSEAVVESVKRLAPLVNSAQVATIMNALNQLDQDIRHAQEPSLNLEVGLLAICMNAMPHDMSALLERLEALEHQLNQLKQGGITHAPAPQQQAPVYRSAPPPSGPPPYNPSAPVAQMPAPQAMPPVMPSPQASPAPAPRQAPAPQPQPSAPAPSNLQDLHQRICALIGSGAVRPLFLQHVHIVEHTDQKLTLSCKSAALLKMMQTPDKLGHYKNAAAQVLGKELHIAFQVGTSSPPPAMNAQPARSNVVAPQSNPHNTLEGQTLIPVEVATPAPPQVAAPPVAMPPQAPKAPASLDAMPSLSFDDTPPMPSSSEPPPLWEDEDAVSPVVQASPASIAVSAPVTGSVTIQGSGDDLEESKSQALTLLKATDIEVTTVDDEDAGAIQGTLLGVGEGIEED